MKTLIAISALLATISLPTVAHAQYSSRCSRDYFGNFRCSGSDGSSIRMTSDSFGNTRTTIRDGNGNSQTCRSSSDYFGNVRTSCY